MPILPRSAPWFASLLLVLPACTLPVTTITGLVCLEAQAQCLTDDPWGNGDGGGGWDWGDWGGDDGGDDGAPADPPGDGAPPNDGATGSDAGQPPPDDGGDPDDDDQDPGDQQPGLTQADISSHPRRHPPGMTDSYTPTYCKAYGYFLATATAVSLGQTEEAAILAAIALDQAQTAMVEGIECPGMGRIMHSLQRYVDTGVLLYTAPGGLGIIFGPDAVGLIGDDGKIIYTTLAEIFAAMDAAQWESIVYGFSFYPPLDLIPAPPVSELDPDWAPGETPEVPSYPG